MTSHEFDHRHILWPGMSRRQTSVSIARNNKVKTLIKDDQSKQELSPLPHCKGKRLTYSASHSSRGYTTSTTDIFSSESSTICQYYNDVDKESSRRLSPQEPSAARTSSASTTRTENYYRWLIPHRIYLSRPPSSMEYTVPLVRRNRRMEYACKPNNERIISVQPRYHHPETIPTKQSRLYWQGMTKAELERYLRTRRSVKSTQTENNCRASKSRPSVSSFDSYKSRIFRSCPSCFGADDSGGSDYSSSDESDGGGSYHL